MLRFLPGELLAAKVLATQSRDLDLAVLKVEASESLVDHVNSLPFTMFASAASLRPRDDVFKIGYPEGNLWFRDFREDKVREIDGVTLVVQAETDSGYSGGVFIDRENRIVGMIRQTRDRVTLATTADAVLSRLNSWNYPVRWRPGTQRRETLPPVQPDFATITLRYTRDLLGCGLNLSFSLGGQTVVPTSSYHQVAYVALGRTHYVISGTIACPRWGQCMANESGTLVVRDGAIYDLLWRYTSFGVCAAQLLDTGG